MRLADQLSASLGGADIADLTRLSGGASRETWSFTADGVAELTASQRSSVSARSTTTISRKAKRQPIPSSKP